MSEPVEQEASVYSVPKRPVLFCVACGGRTDSPFRCSGQVYCETCMTARGAFITKDSGARQTFDSGMVRDTTTGKTDYSLVLSGPMFERWAGLLTRGAIKYDRDNWLKANGQAELDRFRQSAFRHFVQWYRGDTDEDHAAACYFNINGAEYVKSRMVESGKTL